MAIFFISCQFWLFFWQKKPKSKDSFFYWIFFYWEASTYQISKNFIKRFEFWQFSSFLVNFGCFFGKKKPKSKNSFFYWIFFYWEASKYQISKNFIKRFEFWQFSSFLVNFGWFFDKKRPKSKNSFSIEFSYIGKHLHTKFQKISSNGLNFGNFLHFWSILAVFW